MCANYVIRITDQWFGLTYVQIAVAVLVAVLGIVNALTVSITDRRRELGVLHAVGGLRHQIRHTVWMEAMAIGIDRVGAGSGAGRDAALLQRGDCAPRSDRHRHRLRVSVPNRAGAGSGDSGTGFSRRAGTGRERGARIA